MGTKLRRVEFITPPGEVKFAYFHGLYYAGNGIDAGLKAAIELENGELLLTHISRITFLDRPL